MFAAIFSSILVLKWPKTVDHVNFNDFYKGMVFYTLSRAIGAPLVQREREKEVLLGLRYPVALRRSVGLISILGRPNFWIFSKSLNSVQNAILFQLFQKQNQNLTKISHLVNKITKTSKIAIFGPTSNLTVIWLQQVPRLLVVRRHCLLFSRGHSTVSNLWYSDD